jgi:hypothetical protein
MHVRIKIKQEFYQSMVYIANEGRHIRILCIFSHPQNDIDDEVTPGASPTGASPTGVSPTDDKQEDQPEEQNTDNKEGEDEDEDV